MRPLHRLSGRPQIVLPLISLPLLSRPWKALRPRSGLSVPDLKAAMLPLVLALWMLSSTVTGPLALAPKALAQKALLQKADATTGNAPPAPQTPQQEKAPATKIEGLTSQGLTSQGPALDVAVFRPVVQAALAFLGPRTLQAYTARQFSLWGLAGISALEPGLRVVEAPDGVRLMKDQAVILQHSLPPENDGRAWGGLVADFFARAWDVSDVLQAAGQNGVTKSFFDELFNHLDPYSHYTPPASAETERAVRGGGAAGIGVSLSEQLAPSGDRRKRRKAETRHIVVSAVNTNGPAWPAGIDVGERIVSVDGHAVAGLALPEVEALISGPVDSQVVIRLYSPVTRRTRTLTMRRAAVPAETVYAFNAGPIVIVRITSFSSQTAEEMSQYLDQAVQDRHLRGLIIDLRGNRGGVLQQAVMASALLLDNGVAAITKGRDPQANHIWAVMGSDMTNHLPVVVLVDGRTASAAEILAAALADHRRAVVVGSATLGKGLVQTVAQLPDRGELFVTWSRVVAPLGWPLQGLGVMPQLCTSKGESDVEQQIGALKKGRALDESVVRESRAARYPLAVSRILEIRRSCPAALGGDLDLETARDLIDHPAAYRAALSMIPEEMPMGADE